MEDLSESKFTSSSSSSLDQSLSTSTIHGPSSVFQFKKSRLSSHAADDEAELFNVFNVNDVSCSVDCVVFAFRILEPQEVNFSSYIYCMFVFYFIVLCSSVRSSDQHFLDPTPSSTNFGSRSFRYVISCHLEFNTPRNTLISNHQNIQMQPKNKLLMFPSA